MRASWFNPSRLFFYNLVNVHLMSTVLDPCYLISPSGRTCLSREAPKSNQSGPITARHKLFQRLRSIDWCWQTVLYVIPLNLTYRPRDRILLADHIILPKLAWHGMGWGKKAHWFARDCACAGCWNHRGTGHLCSMMLLTRTIFLSKTSQALGFLKGRCIRGSRIEER